MGTTLHSTPAFAPLPFQQRTSIACRRRYIHGKWHGTAKADRYRRALYQHMCTKSLTSRGAQGWEEPGSPVARISIIRTALSSPISTDETPHKQVMAPQPSCPCPFWESQPCLVSGSRLFAFAPSPHHLIASTPPSCAAAAPAPLLSLSVAVPAQAGEDAAASGETALGRQLLTAQ